MTKTIASLITIYARVNSGQITAFYDCCSYVDKIACAFYHCCLVIHMKASSRNCWAFPPQSLFYVTNKWKSSNILHWFSTFFQKLTSVGCCLLEEKFPARGIKATEKKGIAKSSRYYDFFFP